QRIVEVSATVTAGQDLGTLFEQVNERLDGLDLPEAYALYAGGAEESLKEGRNTGLMLSLLALFLVYVVMAVQYESLRNPMIILISVPFSLVGVAMGVIATDIPLSMPVWLGIIMLAGIVVNNAIVLVEQIEILRDRGRDRVESIITAAGQRLRPILMTMLTTVFGMLPLAIGFGEGAELLQPLAIVITWGLSFSLLVSLVVVPATYRLIGRG
ncbi:MAG: efflux RND transporter permease subunit, partial [Gammaproteobacteria bacterium]|nr:efflux RND transporter permease subunit [Gammaproteobacteria bacterium]